MVEDEQQPISSSTLVSSSLRGQCPPGEAVAAPWPLKTGRRVVLEAPERMAGRRRIWSQDSAPSASTHLAATATATATGGGIVLHPLLLQIEQREIHKIESNSIGLGSGDEPDTRGEI